MTWTKSGGGWLICSCRNAKKTETALVAAIGRSGSVRAIGKKYNNVNLLAIYGGGECLLHNCKRMIRIPARNAGIA